jgi:SAM-dependent methyltransferase
LQVVSDFVVPGSCIADIGAGDRFFDHQLIAAYPHIKEITAVDVNYENEGDNDERIVTCTDVVALKDGHFDIIFMMDVLEHIFDDKLFFATVMSKLKMGGKVVITVPAFQQLYSNHDRFLKHYRRYSKKQLDELFCRQPLSIVSQYYFYTSLWVIRWLQMKYEQKESTVHDDGVGHWQYGREHIITRMIKLVLDCDFELNHYLYKWGIIPPGLSLLAICTKTSG